MNVPCSSPKTSFSVSSQNFIIAGLLAAACQFATAQSPERSIWLNQQNSLSQFTTSPSFSLAPSQSSPWTGNLSFTSSGDNYGQRVRGSIVPTVTGNWRFWIAANDQAELWLSPSWKSSEKRKVAHLYSSVGSLAFDVSSSQRSELVPLVAGVPYYFEILHKDYWGDDHAAVAWAYESPNWALASHGSIATQSSTSSGGVPSRAIDGNTNGFWNNDSVTHTANQQNTWWQLDFGQERTINRVVLWNRTDINLGQRLTDFRISVRDSAGIELVGENFFPPGSGHAGASLIWDLPQAVAAHQIRVSLHGTNSDGFGILSLAEVQAFETHSANTRVIVPASALQSQITDPDDLNGNSLPDAWETNYNLTHSSGNGAPASEYADQDADLLTNLEEAQLGFDPLTPSRVPGHFLNERWDSIDGYSVDELVTSPAFYGPPNARLLTSPSALKFTGTYFGTRTRGYIKPQISGDYTFWISAGTSAELFLSDVTTQGKYAKRPIAMLDPNIGTSNGIHSNVSNLWDQYTSQRSEPIRLEAGQSYYIEILHKNGHGANSHSSIAWACDGGSRTSIPASVVESYVTTSDDADDDYLPDAWETQYGLSTLDNGLIDQAREGERGDYDLDGLTNRIEYLLGTDPTNPDTDGDGIIDSAEINSYGTDPTVSDAPSGLVTSTLDLTTYITTGSAWTLASPGLIPSSFQGSINWNFSVPCDGFWLLDVATILLGDLYLHETVNIEVLIDGVSMGEKKLVYGSNREALLRVFTPYLTAGNHNIGLKIKNDVTRRMVGIQSIKVIEPQGADLNSDGIPDWVAAQIMGENALRPYSVTSRVSPANLEGSARMRSQTTLNGNPVTAGLDQSHWYADLALDASTPTAFSVLFEQGFEEAGAITWQSTNVFSSETLTIRKGDSLKLIGQALTGATGQSVTLTFGPANWDGTVGTTGTYQVQLATDSAHHIYTLTAAGNYKVRATLADSSTALMSIIVKKADFSATPKDLLANKTGSLSFSTSTVSSSAHFDGGQTVFITNPATLSGSNIILNAAPMQKSGSSHLLARLHDDGAVIGRQSLNLINVTDVFQNDSSLSYISADFPGYKIIRSPIVATDLPEGATIVITIFRAGVTFLDGTTVRTLSASDFVNGVYDLEFLFPEGLDGGYCHYVDIYDRDGKFLGRR